MTVACGTILIVFTAITNNTMAINPKNRKARADVTGSIIASDPSNYTHYIS
jgi:hypothetical protein